MLLLGICFLQAINCLPINETKSSNETQTNIPNLISKFKDVFNSGMSINQETFEKIKQLVSPGGTIVEIGSGNATEALTSLYSVYSIEDDLKWVNKVNKSHYIYAPLKSYNISEFPDHKMWYDADIIEANLPAKYDLILVDGPLDVATGRGGFYKFINIFDTTVPIVFDDAMEPSVNKLLNLVSKYIKRPYNIFTGTLKSFAVIEKASKVNLY